MADSNEELLDILDENRNVIDVKPRDYVHEHELFHNALHVYVLNSKNEVLIQKRSENVSYWKGLWHPCAAGGHFTTSEAPLEGAVKETSEEIGINLPEGEFTKILEYEDKTYMKELGKYHHCLLYVYYIKVDLRIDQIKIDGDEVSEVKYISIDDLVDKINDPGEYKYFVPEGKDYYFAALDKLSKIIDNG